MTDMGRIGDGGVSKLQTEPVQSLQKSQELRKQQSDHLRESSFHQDGDKKTQDKAAVSAGEDTQKNFLNEEKLVREEMEQIRESVNSVLSQIKIGLEFSENDETESLVVKVKNLETEELIRQIPPEAFLKLAERMEELSGLFVDMWS